MPQLIIGETAAPSKKVPVRVSDNGELIAVVPPTSLWTCTSVAMVAGTSKVILSANTLSGKRVFRNPLATPLYLRFNSATASALPNGHDIVVPPVNSDGVPGQFILEPGEYRGEVRAMCDTTGNIGVSESR